MCCCMARRSGRAPYVRSNPASASQSLAASVSAIVTPCSTRRASTSCSISSTMCRTCSDVSDSKTMVSSSLFRNSGRKVRRSASSTDACRRADSPCWLPVTNPAVRRFASEVPRLLVMMTSVLRKSTVLPCPSVSRPSSRICRSVLNTSGCAFSISSNRITRKGRRRTASVSCPPSS